MSDTHAVNGGINTIEAALAALGASSSLLTIEQKNSLDQQGYLIFPNLISPEWLAQLRTTYEELMEKEGQSAGIEVYQEVGTRRLADLVNKGSVFDGVYTQPLLLASVYHILRQDFKLYSLNGRDAIPGHGQQDLHMDWGSRDDLTTFAVVNSIWMLDDFTPENGATCLIPGSHRWAGQPDNTARPHPQEVLLVAPSGSVAVFNAHIWHGGTLNHTDQTRRALHCSFSARQYPQQLNQQEYIRKSTYERLSPAARYILDV